MLNLPRFHGDGWTMSSTATPAHLHHGARPMAQGSIPAMALAALGVVFGDIGTSPLYTLKVILALGGGGQDVARATALGSLSLIVWTLVVVATIKYVFVAMRVDNHGEGGIMALMALLGGRKKKRTVIIAFGLFGAALIYGDGAITPAISVLSALEGLSVLTPRLEPFVVPLTVAILVLLFLVQPRGTAAIGRMFGPIMLVWFGAMGVLGIWGIVQNPAVLAALNPLVGLGYLFSGGRLVPRARRGISVRDRRGGPLRRHGPFRPPSHPGGLACHRFPLPCLELRGSGRAGPERRAG